MGRAPCCDKASVKKGPWSPEEDAKLKSYIEKHGTGGNWIALPQKIGLKRCGKSCRLRWLNYLRPNIKHGGFSEEEENFICSLYLSIGSRWSIIAAQLPGRTDNDIKNYWNTRLKKKLLGKQRKNQRTRSVSCVKQEIKRESDNILAMEAVNIFPQFQQSVALPTVVPFQEELFHGGNRLSNGITCSSLHPRDVFYCEGQPCLQPSLDMTATSISLNSVSTTISPLPSIYCPMNGMIATSFQYCNNLSSGLDGTDYSNPEQILDGLESFWGMDMVNKSTITTTSPESTSLEDISSIVSSPVFFNYEISQQAMPQDCTFQEYPRELEMQQRQYCTSML